MTVCRACYRIRKERERQSLEDENADLRVKVATLECRLFDLERALVVNDEMRARLIRLCHPDRHGGSKAATEVTQWLLSKRR
jgi:hypothetical protein